MIWAHSCELLTGLWRPAPPLPFVWACGTHVKQLAHFTHIHMIASTRHLRTQGRFLLRSQRAQRSHWAPSRGRLIHCVLPGDISIVLLKGTVYEEISSLCSVPSDILALCMVQHIDRSSEEQVGSYVLKFRCDKGFSWNRKSILCFDAIGDTFSLENFYIPVLQKSKSCFYVNRWCQ